MPYKKVDFKAHAERKAISDSLNRFKDPMAYSDEVSKAIYTAAVEKVKTCAEDLNAKYDAAEAAGIAYDASLEEVDALLRRLRKCIAGAKGNNSEEFVAAGGTRQSDVTAAQQQSREANKRAAEEAAKKAADEAAKKAFDEAVKKALDEAAKKAADDAAK